MSYTRNMSSGNQLWIDYQRGKTTLDNMSKQQRKEFFQYGVDTKKVSLNELNPKLVGDLGLVDNSVPSNEAPSYIKKQLDRNINLMDTIPTQSVSSQPQNIVGEILNQMKPMQAIQHTQNISQPTIGPMTKLQNPSFNIYDAKGRINPQAVVNKGIIEQESQVEENQVVQSPMTKPNSSVHDDLQNVINGSMPFEDYLGKYGQYMTEEDKQGLQTLSTPQKIDYTQDITALEQGEMTVNQFIEKNGQYVGKTDLHKYIYQNSSPVPEEVKLINLLRMAQDGRSLETDAKTVGNHLKRGVLSTEVGVSKLAQALNMPAHLIYNALHAGLKQVGVDIGKDPLDSYLNNHMGEVEDVSSKVTKEIEEANPSKVANLIGHGVEPLPQVALGALGGGVVGASSKVASLSGPVATELATMLPFGAIAGGSYAREAENEGANEIEQLTYGLAGGTGEMLTELIPFKNAKEIFKKAGAGQLFNKGAKTFMGRYGKSGLKILTNMMEEAVQEVVMSPITQTSKKVIYDKDVPLTGEGGILSFNQAKEDAYGGLAMAIVLGAFGLPSTALSHKMASRMVEDGEITTGEIQALRDQEERDLQKKEVAEEVKKEIYRPKPMENGPSAEEVHTEEMINNAEENVNFDPNRKIKYANKQGITEEQFNESILDNVEENPNVKQMQEIHDQQEIKAPVNAIKEKVEAETDNNVNEEATKDTKIDSPKIQTKEEVAPTQVEPENIVEEELSQKEDVEQKEPLKKITGKEIKNTIESKLDEFKNSRLEVMGKNYEHYQVDIRENNGKKKIYVNRKYSVSQGKKIRRACAGIIHLDPKTDKILKVERGDDTAQVRHFVTDLIEGLQKDQEACNDNMSIETHRRANEGSESIRDTPQKNKEPFITENIEFEEGDEVEFQDNDEKRLTGKIKRISGFSENNASLGQMAEVYVEDIAKEGGGPIARSEIVPIKSLKKIKDDNVENGEVHNIEPETNQEIIGELLETEKDDNIKQQSNSNLSQTSAYYGGGVALEQPKMMARKSKPIQRVSKIIEGIKKDFHVSVSSKRFRGRKALATYNNHSHAISTKIDNAIGPIMHELGHHLDNKYQLAKNNKILIKSMTDKLPNEFAEQYPDNKLPGEAVAEFVRLYLTNPESAVEYGGGFYTQFQNSLNKNDFQKLDEHKQDILNWLQAEKKDQFESTIVSYTEKDSSSLDYKKMQTHMFITDDLAPIDEFRKTVEGLSDKKLSTVDNMYIKALHSRKYDLISRQITLENLLDTESNVIGEGLKGIMKPIKSKESKAFDTYLKLRHAIDWAKEGKRVFSDDFTLQDVKAQIQSYEEEYNHFKETSDSLYEWWHKFIQSWLVDTGLMEQGLWEKMKEMYPHYVPNYRHSEEMVNTDHGMKKGKRGFANQTNPMKRASKEGSAKDTYSAIESMVLDIDRICKTVGRREVMLSIHKQYNKVEGLGDILRKISPEMQGHRFDARDLKTKLIIGLTENYLDKIPKGEKEKLDKMELPEVLEYLQKNGYEVPDVVDSIMADTINFFTAKKTSTDSSIVTLIDEKGKTHFYEVYDPLLLEAMSNLNDKQLDKVVQMLGAVKRFMTVLTTGSNPIFGITSNVWRDVQQAYVYGHEANALRYTKELFTAMKSIMTNDEIYKMYKNMGGGYTSPVGANRKVLNEVLTELVPSRSKNVTGQINKLISAVEKFNDTIETAPRLVEFKHFIDKGGDSYNNRLKAMYESTDVTLNFTRHGQITNTAIGQAIPFLNAGIQGLDKFKRVIVDDKGDRTSRVARALTSITLFTLATCIIYRDDDDYKKLSNHIKDSYWVIKYDNGKFIRIPKPRELNFVFGTLFDRAYRQVFEEDPEAWEGIELSLKNSFVPSFRSIFAPLIDVKSNKSWGDSPIVSKKLETLPNKEQSDESTSQIAIYLSQVMPDMLGRYTSPKNIDYLLKQYTGLFGQLVLPATISNEFKPQNTVKGVARRMTTDVAYSNDYVNEFYEIKSKLDQSYSLLKSKKKKDENLNIYQKKKAGKYSTYMSKYWKQIDRIKTQNNISDSKKEELIRNYRLKILDLAKDFVEKYNKSLED